MLMNVLLEEVTPACLVGVLLEGAKDAHCVIRAVYECVRVDL